MLIIQYRAHDYLLQQLDEGYIGLTFMLKGNKIPGSVFRNMDQPRLLIHDGHILIKKFELLAEGKNEVSSFSKNLKIDFNETKKVHFEQGEKSAEDFFLNIPAGKYEKLTFGILLQEYEELSPVYMEASFVQDNDEIIPVQIHIDGIMPRIEMELDQELTFYSKHSSDQIVNPSIVFEINAQNWLEDISNKDFMEAEREGNTIKISRQHNPILFHKIRKAILHGNEFQVIWK